MREKSENGLFRFGSRLIRMPGECSQELRQFTRVSGSGCC